MAALDLTGYKLTFDNEFNSLSQVESLLLVLGNSVCGEALRR
jgi:hypothetical protein